MLWRQKPAPQPRGIALAKIYTKSGDDGSTGLIGGKRVPKDAARVSACGDVDELNAVLGLVSSQGMPEHIEKILQRIQDDLFTVGANLALPAGTDSAEWKVPLITEEDIAALEEDIDACDSLLEPLQQFILPGGSGGGAMLHFARTVARRAERSCVTLSSIETVDPKIIRYLNRVSDLCFVLARDLNRQSGRPESHPTFSKR
jgi:cob(I)alamin adenosyltransferase